MASQAEQPCLVCGTKTKNVCSSCRKAGIDLFFCSPEHQKLVWSKHKLVCGPGKAKPFLWPRLSSEEAAEAIEHRKTKTFTDASLEGFFQLAFGVPPAQLPGAINALTGPPPSDIEELSYQNALIGQVRYCEALRWQSRPLNAPPPPPTLAESGPQSFVHNLTVYAYNLARGAAFGYDEPEGRDAFLHQLLVFAVLLQAPEAPPAQRAEQLKQRRTALRLVGEKVGVLPGEDRELAPALLRQFGEMLDGTERKG
ncbi:hypothetical protein JCM10450v2_003504 [Rhodotorula kratochvilovae]